MYTCKAFQVGIFVAWRGAIHQLENFESNCLKYWGSLVWETQLCSCDLFSVFLDCTPSHEQLLCANTTILTCVHVPDSWASPLKNCTEIIYAARIKREASY